MGAPVIPHAVPYVGGREAEYVAGALAAGEVASGAFVGLFEAAVAAFTGARHAIATSSGTAALHVALVAAGVKPGDRVIVPATTFIATVNAVLMCRARPVIVDVDGHGLLPAEVVARHIRLGPAFAIPVHLYGHPCHLDALRKTGARLIEDAAEALGATYRGIPIGQRGTATLSFNGNKLITTGGGGMVLTDDAKLAEQVRALINQRKAPGDLLVYRAGGFNYRMPNVNAAIGLAQMESIEARLKAKRETAEHYQVGLGSRLLNEPAYGTSSYWLPVVLMPNARTTQRRLAQNGIETRRVWRPLHRQPGIRRYAPHPYPFADLFYAGGLTLPSSVGITPEERERVIEALRHA